LTPGGSPAAPYRLEACVTSLPEAMAAAERAADRLEVCTALETEGMTPARDLVADIVRSVQTPVRVLIRETPIGFEAPPGVLKAMLRAISQFLDWPIEGFVLGVLGQDGQIDEPALAALLDAAAGRPCTFHKAIDTVPDPISAAGLLNTWPGVDTILTSGGAPTALAGASVIRQMQMAFRGRIMAGGSIRQADLPILHGELGLAWYHGRAIVGSLPDH